MKLLLDTCVVSELNHPKGDRNVAERMLTFDPQSVYLSVFVIGEVVKGIHSLPHSRRRMLLQNWVEDLQVRFVGQILSFDLETALIWGRIVSDARRIGRPIAVEDSVIAATAIANGCVVATRNVKDFEVVGVEVYNPWKQ